MNSSLLASGGHRLSPLAHRGPHRGKRTHRWLRKSDPTRAAERTRSPSGSDAVTRRMIPANKRARGRGLINRRFPLQPLLCSSFPHLDLLSKACTMPAILRSSAPIKKALCIGVEYRELADEFPDLGLRLPAAHKDPVMMSRLLQGGSQTSVNVSQL